MTAVYDQSNSDSDQQQNNNQLQTDNVTSARSSHRPSFDHSSLTSDSGVGGGGGIGHRSFSSVIPLIVGEGQVVGTYWESRDLSRRSNIHRSHLSSSIQTGILLRRIA